MDPDQLDLWPGDEPDNIAQRDARSAQSSITRIEQDPACRQRQLVHLDDRQCISVHAKVLKQLDLQAGQQWIRRDLARQSRELETKSAQEAAIALLARRSRSVADLGKRLRRKGYSTTAWSAVIRRLSELQLLNDEQFAVELHEALQRRQKLGRRAILDRMQKEGLPRDLAMRVIEERTEDEEEAQRAFELARKRLSRMKVTDPMKARRRVYAHLVRRGFSPGHAAAATRQAMEAAGESDADDGDTWDAGV